MTFENNIQKIDDIEKELDKIFDIVTSEKNISSYKSMLLTTKLSILKDALDNIILSLMQESIINIYNVLKYQKINLILFILAFVLVFVYPLGGLSLNLISWMMKFKIDKKMALARDDMQKVESLSERSNEMTVTFDNCYRFLEARTNYEIKAKEDEINDLELKKIQLANDVIQISVMGEFNDSIPQEIQDIMKKMLQDDLQTDEQDLEKLINMASEKVMNQVLEQVEENGKIQTKTLEIDKK